MDIFSATYPFTLPPLPYAYNALEPYIDEETVHIHHGKHFATYIKNLNDALEPYPYMQMLTIEEILCGVHRLPPPDQVKILRNAGGVYNHAIYFANLAPASEDVHTPEGNLLEAIEGFYGSFENFKEKFSKAASEVFGSGWTILASDRCGNLSIRNVANQETLICEGLQTVILFDVWEHAYYLKYRNERKKYIENLWNIIRFK